MRPQKQLPFASLSPSSSPSSHLHLDNKKTKQPLYLSTLTLQSPTHKPFFFKNKPHPTQHQRQKQKTLKNSQSYKYRSKQPPKNEDIKAAVEIRFSRCKMNYDYRYRVNNDKRERNESHSSQMEEFRDLKGLVGGCNLTEWNRRLARKEREKEREVKTGRSGRVVGASESQRLIRKGETYSPMALGVFLKTSKVGKLKRDESPVSIGIQRDYNSSQLLNKSSIRKDKDPKPRSISRQKQRAIIRTIESNPNSNAIKYTTTISPYARNNNNKKIRDQYSSEESMSRGIKSYSTLRLNSSKPKKIESSKMITIESNTSKEGVERDKKMFVNKGKRKRMYSHQRL